MYDDDAGESRHLMDAIIDRPPSLHGSLTVPPDKAVCHRAVLMAAVARGETEIRPWPMADDCQQTAALVEYLGVPVARTRQTLRVTGQGKDAILVATRDLFCGESGTTLRLAAGLLSGQPATSTLSAGPALSRRPMRRLVEPLSQMGARLEGAVSAQGVHEVYPPLSIRGMRPLRAIRYELGVASAQVKSAILLAGLFADGQTTVVERHQTRDHTERALRAFGVRVRTEGLTVSVEPGALTSPGGLSPPGDLSSAAFFIVAACCVPGSVIEVRDVGLNPTRTGVLMVLQRMGAAIRADRLDDGWEPRGTVAVEARPLRATTVEAHEIPSVIDELPILMVAAACAHGTTRFRGIAELRVKETDRVQSMVNGLRQLGVHIHLSAADAVEIEGGQLTGGVVDAAGDHRTAMSLAVAGLVASGDSTTVRGAECVAKSFPEFFDQLRNLGGSSTVKTVDNP